MEFVRPKARICVKNSKTVSFQRSGVLLFLSFFTFMAFSATLSTNVQAGQATLSWSPSTSSGVVGYRLLYGTASGAYSQNLDAGNASTYTVGSLADGQRYYFTAVAYNSAGTQSGYANEEVTPLQHCPHRQQSTPFRQRQAAAVRSAQLVQ